MNKSENIVKRLGSFNEKSRKPAFGKSEGFNYAVQINNLDSNDFFTQSFGRGLSDRRKVEEFINTAKKHTLGQRVDQQ